MLERHDHAQRSLKRTLKSKPLKSLYTKACTTGLPLNPWCNYIKARSQLLDLTPGRF
ncbi:hypothetical protein YC2023_112128 [Brassica napus]